MAVLRWPGLASGRGRKGEWWGRPRPAHWYGLGALWLGPVAAGVAGARPPWWKWGAQAADGEGADRAPGAGQRLDL